MSTTPPTGPPAWSTRTPENVFERVPTSTAHGPASGAGDLIASRTRGLRSRGKRPMRIVAIGLVALTTGALATKAYDAFFNRPAEPVKPISQQIEPFEEPGITSIGTNPPPTEDLVLATLSQELVNPASLRQWALCGAELRAVVTTLQGLGERNLILGPIEGKTVAKMLQEGTGTRIYGTLDAGSLIPAYIKGAEVADANDVPCYTDTPELPVGVVTVERFAAYGALYTFRLPVTGVVRDAPTIEELAARGNCYDRLVQKRLAYEDQIGPSLAAFPDSPQLRAAAAAERARLDALVELSRAAGLWGSNCKQPDS